VKTQTRKWELQYSTSSAVISRCRKLCSTGKGQSQEGRLPEGVMPECSPKSYERVSSLKRRRKIFLNKISAKAQQQKSMNSE
jgi:hypothetical protein